VGFALDPLDSVSEALSFTLDWLNSLVEALDSLAAALNFALE
jgi:hypothetical protein